MGDAPEAAALIRRANDSADSPLCHFRTLPFARNTLLLLETAYVLPSTSTVWNGQMAFGISGRPGTIGYTVGLRKDHAEQERQQARRHVYRHAMRAEPLRAKPQSHFLELEFRKTGQIVQRSSRMGRWARSKFWLFYRYTFSILRSVRIGAAPDSQICKNIRRYPF